MNPALLLVLLSVGSAMLLLGVLAVVLDWLPLASAIAIGAIGAAIETAAAIAFARSRRQARPRR
jgi:NhaP-type Na+/H+ or K+/H+ antiporter